MRFSKVLFFLAIAPLFLHAKSGFENQYNEKTVETTPDLEEASSSVERKMKLFKMGQEFHCPLFSDSPYAEALNAIDQMQRQLNTVFTDCKDKISSSDQIHAIYTQANELRKQIFEAQKMKELEQTQKLNLTTNSIVQLAEKLQQIISTATSTAGQTRICYKSNQEFRGIMSSVSETFQSLAPIVLDFVKLNPTLATVSGSKIKLLTGIESISTGIALMDQFAKGSLMFNMSDETTRTNTIKNVCQFMKLYRRVQYLRLSKIGKTQDIDADFQKKIGALSLNLQKIKQKPAVQQTFQVSEARSTKLAVSNDPGYSLFASLSKSLRAGISKVEKAISDVETAQREYNNPSISQCQTILLVKKDKLIQKTIIDVVTFSKNIVKISDVERLNESMNAYNEELDSIDKSNDKRSCVESGQDWLKMAGQLLSEGQRLVLDYETTMSALNNEKSDLLTMDQKIIRQKEEHIASEKLNYETLKTFINVSAFESAEMNKRFRGMHRYFFNGPRYREFSTECSPEENCLGARLSTHQEWLVNHGPIFSLLKNEEQFFTEEYNKVNEAIKHILYFEQNKVQADNGGRIPHNQSSFDQFIKKTYELSHLSAKHIDSPSDSQFICRQVNVAINSYGVARDYIASSEAMCNMVYPVLSSETDVSSALISYCQPTNGRSSKIQSQIIKLVGNGPALNRSNDVYKNNFKYSMKSVVDKLIQKKDDLECAEKVEIR